MIEATHPHVTLGPLWTLELDIFYGHERHNFMGLLIHSNCPQKTVIYETEVTTLKYIGCTLCAEPAPLHLIKAYLLSKLPVSLT